MLELDLLLRFVVALAVVLALIMGAAWLARRYTVAGRLASLGGKRRRLSIVEALAVDGRNRLVLVRRDEIEHLVMLGPSGGLVVESGIQAQASFPRAIEAVHAE